MTIAFPSSFYGSGALRSILSSLDEERPWRTEPRSAKVQPRAAVSVLCSSEPASAAYSSPALCCQCLGCSRDAVKQAVDLSLERLRYGSSNGGRSRHSSSSAKSYKSGKSRSSPADWRDGVEPISCCCVSDSARNKHDLEFLFTLQLQTFSIQRRLKKKKQVHADDMEEPGRG